MEFYQTKLGQKFYEKDLPSLIKELGELKQDGIVEAYEFFGYAFRTNEWEDFLEPLEIWLKQNNK